MSSQLNLEVRLGARKLVDLYKDQVPLLELKQAIIESIQTYDPTEKTGLTADEEV